MFLIDKYMRWGESQTRTGGPTRTQRARTDDRDAGGELLARTDPYAFAGLR